MDVRLNLCSNIIRFRDFKNFNNFSTSRVKALFGLHSQVHADLPFDILPELEKRRELRMAASVARKSLFKAWQIKRDDYRLAMGLVAVTSMVVDLIQLSLITLYKVAKR